MKSVRVAEEWPVLRAWLPGDLNRAARESGFFQRARGLGSAEVWLQLILMHVAGGLSLEQTVVRARELGLASISAVALFKRLRRAEPWLRSLTAHLLRARAGARRRSSSDEGVSFRLIDATDIQEPGSKGADLRLHYSLQLPELACDHYELSDNRTGEKLAHFQFSPGEIILADRGYCHRAGVAHVRQAGAQVVVRWNTQTFPLEDGQGHPWDPLPWLRSLHAHRAAEHAVFYTHASQRHRLRFCAIRKAQAAAERCRRKLRRRASQRRQQLQPETVEMADYVVVLASLPADCWTPARILQLYRCRWQVELAFKRLKSLLSGGHVPKGSDASAKAWMQAKILSALLIERILEEARLFSPWGFEL